jgi:hypothetical protein
MDPKNIEGSCLLPLFDFPNFLCASPLRRGGPQPMAARHDLTITLIDAAPSQTFCQPASILPAYCGYYFD